MKQTQIRGIIAPVLTPMHEDESVDTRQLRCQIERMIEAGLHGVFVMGTTGEGYALEPEEKRQLVEAAVDQAAGRVPVFAGTGCVTTRQTVAASRMAQQAGADVLSVITPSFAAASQQELYDHYMQTASAVTLPIILYNIPARTGNALAPETVERLARDAENIVGIKDSSGDFENIKRYIAVAGRLDKTFSVLSGNDALILPTLASGGQGGIAGCANVFPHTMAEIYEAYRAGDVERAGRVQASIQPFRDCFKLGNSNTVIKAATAMLGYPVGACRRPFCGLTREAEEQIKRTLDACLAAGLS